MLDGCNVSETFSSTPMKDVSVFDFNHFQINLIPEFIKFIRE